MGSKYGLFFAPLRGGNSTWKVVPAASLLVTVILASQAFAMRLAMESPSP